ncbi:hypothetical protein YC2023_019643 [Brassica napus]
MADPPQPRHIIKKNPSIFFNVQFEAYYAEIIRKYRQLPNKIKNLVGIDGTGLGLVRHHKKLGECVILNSPLL